MPYGPSFPAGCTDPRHLNRWLSAMTAGRRAKYPKCAHIHRDDTGCRSPPMRGADLCHIHLGGDARDAYDRKRELELRLIANGVRNKGEPRGRAIA